MNIQETINKHEASLNELVGFHDQSKDEHNKQFLGSEINLLKSKISELKRTLNPETQVIRYRTLQNYSWDQTDDLIKIYLSLSEFDGKEIKKESCKVEVLDNNLTLVITVENAKLTIKNLTSAVKTLNDNFVKITKSFVIVSLMKVEKHKWASLQKSKTNKSVDDFKPEKDEDPSQSMMSLMKKMYNEGDDEMKRMINKAWCEKNSSNAFM